MVSLPPIIRSVLVCVAASLGVAGVARGAPPSPPPSPKIDSSESRIAPGSGLTTKELKKKLAARATNAMHANELAETYEALKAIYALDSSSLNIICNIGTVSRRLKLYVEATENLTRCMKVCTPLPSNPEDSDRCKELVAELSMARTKVAVVVLNGPKGAKVTVDGRPMAPLDPDREIFVEPGTREIVVAGRAQRVFLQEGTTTPVDFSPPPPPREPLSSTSARPTPTKAPPPPPSPTAIRIPEVITIAGWIGAGLAATAGGMFLTVSQLKHAEAERELSRSVEETPQGCSNAARSPIHCPAFKEARDDADRYQFAAIGTFAGAGALAIGTGIFMSLSPSPSSSPSPSPARVEVGVGSIRVVVPW